MTHIFTIIAAIIIFAVLIFVHEAGHFITAKLSGVKVLEFALGMGPKVVSFKKGETLYSLRALPLGGFCSMEGEDGGSDDTRSFANKPAWKRFIVLASGAAMNILLGFLLLCILFSGQEAYISNKVSTVDENSAAYAAGMLSGDVITEINGKNVHIGADVQYLAMSADEKNAVEVKRNGEKLVLNIEKPTGEPFGITLMTEEMTVFSVVRQSYYQTLFYSKVIIESLLDLIKGKASVQNMSGAIGIVSEIGNAVEEGMAEGGSMLRLMSLTILLTINLGIFNVLPIPALDGGRILFVLIEMITKKRLPPEKEGMVHMIGFAVLIAFAIFVSYLDVLKIVK